MTSLTGKEKDRMLQFMERNGPVLWNKQQLIDAAQAVEDLLDGTTLIVAGDVGKGLPAIFSEDIDTATSPLVLTNPQKKKLAAKVFEAKFGRDK